MLKMVNKQTGTAAALETAFDRLAAVIRQRLLCYVNGETLLLQKWIKEQWNGNFIPNELLVHMEEPLSNDEWLVVLLALVPHLQPGFYERLIQEHYPEGGEFAEFGGARTGQVRSMQPTGQTAQFVLAGMDIAGRIRVARYFSPEHFFFRYQVLQLENNKEQDVPMGARIVLSAEWLHHLFNGTEMPAAFDAEFPARCISTQMNWDDLVLNEHTLGQVNDLKIWMEHNTALLNDAVLGRKIKPGFRVLFHGPPGTGKTLTASLLGKQFQKEVYRIDLSQIVSKFIGETEKNLEKVFAKAATKDWILFFDEADALFGKRTSVQSSHDKYANQEVAYLLQRIEEFSGLLILASNLKTNMDEAFVRRFHSIIHFPSPGPQERFRLWEKTIPQQLPPEQAVNLVQLAEKYELNGASILNILHSASLKALSRGDNCLRMADIQEAIRKEFRKEERTIL